MTNCHVVRRPVRINVWLADGRRRRATVVGTDAATDLAVLRLVPESTGESFPAAALAENDTLQAGDRVWAAGSPGNLSQALTAGVVANPALSLPDERTLPLIDGERVGRLVRWIAHDAPIFPGNSGGPLMAADGRVVGINEISVAGLGGAIPAGLAQKVAGELIAHGRVTRAWLGVEWQPAPEGENGVRVGAVWPGAPADKAGVRAGDIVVRLAGRPLNAATPDALIGVARAEEACGLETPCDLSLRRGDKEWVRQIKPESRPPARMPPVELPVLGAVVRDMTPPFSWEKNLAGTDGVWVESVRPGGKLGQARPALGSGDRIVAVGGVPIRNVSDLQAVMKRDHGNALVEFERERRDWVALLMPSVASRPVGSSRRGWLGLEVQVLERPLAEKFGVPSGAVLRVTEVPEGTSAERAGFKTGDILLAVDGERPEVSRQEDADVLGAMLRSRRPGSKMPVMIRRDGEELTLLATVDARPVPAAEMERMEWPELELTVRAATAEDRRLAGLTPDAPALLVAQVESAGWAELAGLAAGDLLLTINAQPVHSLAGLAALRGTITASATPAKVAITVQRGRYRTVLAEIENTTLP